MKRVMITGGCGSGKSTLARKLQPLLGLDLIHLDQHYWQPNWVEPTKEAWKNTVQKLIEKDSWIIDGNYSDTMDIRLERTDTVVYLNYPTWVCLWRALKRVKKNKGTVRPDMAKGCPERFDLGFLWLVLTFKHRSGHKVLNKLDKLQTEKQIFILNNDKEVESFIKNVTPQYSKDLKTTH